jgi:regulator of replication initiation timing
MENIEILAAKVKKAAENLKKITNENHKLKLEVEFLRKENGRNKSLASEYALLKRNTQEITSRIERIMRKIDTAKVS